MNDPLGQSCRAQISSTCFIYSGVIIQKSVFKILRGYSIFLAMSFGDCNAQYSKILDCRSSLFMLSIIGVFFIFGILVYSRRICCIQHIVNSTSDSSSRITSCHAGLYIILWISALWISMGFISLTSQLERSIIDYLTKSDHLILFRMGQSSEVLAVFFYQQTSGQYYYGTIREYIRQKCRDVSVLGFIIQSIVRTTLNYSYLDWYNPRSYPFCVHLPLIEISRTKFL